MTENRYVLRVLLTKGHNVTLLSNKEMTPDAWRRLWRWLAIQREIADELTPPNLGGQICEEEGNG